MIAIWREIRTTSTRTATFLQQDRIGVPPTRRKISGVRKWAHLEVFAILMTYKLDKIIKDFPFFPELHWLFSTRPNITPIAVTTGVGPGGHQTIHYQAPDEVEGPVRPEPVIDPQLLALGVPVPPPAQPVLGTSNHVNLPPSTQPPPLATLRGAENATGFKTPARAPKPATFGSEKLDSAVTKAKESIKTIPSKRGSGIEDVFTEMAK